MARDTRDITEDHTTRAIQRDPLGTGRVGTYAILGAAAGSVPMPWIPDALARRVRGALVQDLSARHGLSITKEARDVLAEPSGTEGPRGIAQQTMRFFTRRVLGRIGPLGILPPVRAGLETFVLGHLLGRYLDIGRTERAARIDVEEARRLRRAIETAFVHAFSAEVKSAAPDVRSPPEELRDPVTQLVDGALGTAASLPSFVLRRLETAFDDVLPRTHA